MSEGQLFEVISAGSEPALFQIAKIVRLAISNPPLMLDLLDGIRSKDIRIAMYCAEAIEKISRLKPALLVGYETEVLTNLAMSNFSEVRGPLSLVVPRLELGENLKRSAVTLMFDYLNDESFILRERVFSALTEVSKTDLSVKERVVPLLHTRLAGTDRGEQIKAKSLLAALSAPIRRTV